ncbi:sulfatase/phosphatase domain-containing protein [Halorubrum tropicale]|uniref:sulfatase/phosphatase domain-containing protein n=1 Tax=Halorubrum tropicale TaxID=1765655 RepID=UPI001111F368
MLSDTVIILVGDHDENIRDHELIDHQYWLYETLLHVPLIIRYPAVFDSGTTEALVETRALYETVADLAGLDSVDADTASSLISNDSQEYTSPQLSVDKLDDEYSPLDPAIWRYDRALRSVRSGRWKLIEASDEKKTEFYDLQADLDESESTNQEDVQVALQQVLTDRRGPMESTDSESVDIRSTSKKWLQDLG